MLGDFGDLLGSFFCELGRELGEEIAVEQAEKEGFGGLQGFLDGLLFDEFLGGAFVLEFFVGGLEFAAEAFGVRAGVKADGEIVAEEQGEVDAVPWEGVGADFFLLFEQGFGNAGGGAGLLHGGVDREPAVVGLAGTTWGVGVLHALDEGAIGFADGFAGGGAFDDFFHPLVSGDEFGAHRSKVFALEGIAVGIEGGRSVRS